MAEKIDADETDIEAHFVYPVRHPESVKVGVNEVTCVPEVAIMSPRTTADPAIAFVV